MKKIFIIVLAILVGATLLTEAKASDVTQSNTPAQVYFSLKGGCTDFLTNANIPVYIDAKHAVAHNKVMIFDRETVITGFFNFTKAAEEKNAENLLVLKNKELATLYVENWERHREHSESYTYKGR